LIFTVQLTAAQERSDARNEKGIEKASEKKALALLEEAGAAALTLALAENRVFIHMSVVDLLWAHDEKRARAIFDDATSSLIRLISNADNRADQDSVLSHLHAYLRNEMLRVAASHDVELALDFLRATRRSSLQPEGGSRVADVELEVEQNLSAQIAANDPKRALQMAERSLEHGISSGLITLLSRLRERDDEAATKLAKAILTKVRSLNLRSNEQARGAVMYLLQTAIRSHERAAASKETRTSEKQSPPILDLLSTRELMEIVATAALSAPLGDPVVNPKEYEIAKNFVWSLKFMRLAVDKYSPSHSSVLRARLAQINKRLDADNRIRSEFYDLLQEDNLDEALEIIAKAPPESRDMLYYEAAGKVLESGDKERGRELAGKISNSEWRKQVIADIERQSIVGAASDGKLDQVRQLLSRVGHDDERVKTLVQLATTLAKKGNNRVALELLSEARGLVSGRAETLAEIRARIEVARAYMSLEPGVSFDIIEPLIDQFNEISAAVLVLDRFEYRRFTRDGEFLLMQSSTLLNGIPAQFVYELSSLARADFDRARNAAERFKLPETRAYARLLVAKGALTAQRD
jgi:hypothetical protein